MATVAVERVAMGWRRDAEGTSKGRRVPLTRRNDLHDAEGTSKGLSLDAKGCPFRRRDCPFTRRDRAKGLSLHAKGSREGIVPSREGMRRRGRLATIFFGIYALRARPNSARLRGGVCMHVFPLFPCCSTLNTCLTHRLDNA